MGGKSSVINWRYYLGIEHVYSWGPIDEMFAIRANQRVAWEGGVTDTSNIEINQRDLFGGPKRFGGMVGTVEVRMGKDDQMPSAYVERVTGIELPAMRKVFSLVFRAHNFFEGLNGAETLATKLSFIGSIATGFYWSAGNPSIPTVALDCRRNIKGWHGEVFYPEKAMIADGDQNAMHIIYECTVDQAWGGRWTEADIDHDNAVAVADQLYAEGFGLSFFWMRQDKVDSFIEQVLAHINAVRYVDPRTGKFTVKLVRNDYDPETVLHLDDDHILEITRFQRRTWDSAVNQITLIYCDPDTDLDASVVVNNPAGIRRQGGQVINQTTRMPGIRQHALALRVAQRELFQAGAPLAAFEMVIDRIGYDIRMGDVLSVTYQVETSEGPLDLDDFLVRVLRIDYGSLSDESIKVAVSEDIFAMPANSMRATQPALWDNPAGTPAQIATVLLTEVPYLIMQQQLSQVEVDALDPTNSYPLIMAKKPSGRNFEMGVYQSLTTTTTDFINIGQDAYTPTALLDENIDKDDTTFEYLGESGAPMDQVIGGFMLVGDEWMSIESVDELTHEVTVKRGILDSMPKTHTSGARLWLYCGTFGFEGLAVAEAPEATEGETLYYRETGKSTALETSLATAPQQSHVHAADWSRPYPPANVQIDGAYTPASVTTTFELTWSGRNKQLQTEDYVGWYEGHIAPPAGTTYAVEVVDTDTSTVLFSDDTITGHSFTYASAAAANVRITLRSSYNGRESRETWVYECPMV